MSDAPSQMADWLAQVVEPIEDPSRRIVDPHHHLWHDRGLMPATPPRAVVIVIPVGEEVEAPARKVVLELRRAGIRTELPYSPAGVGKELKGADQHRIPFAVVVGPEEWEAEEVNLKDV